MVRLVREASSHGYPPKAVHPMSTKCLAMSAKPTWTWQALGSTLLFGHSSRTTFIEELCTFAGAWLFASSTSISSLAMVSRQCLSSPLRKLAEPKGLQHAQRTIAFLEASCRMIRTQKYAKHSKKKGLPAAFESWPSLAFASGAV